MPLSELLGRSRQEVGKRIDAALASSGYDFARSATREDDVEAPSFFFTAEALPRILDVLRSRLPAQVEKLIAEAERICAHRFDVLGYTGIDYGPEIDWHADPVHGKTAPIAAFHRVRFLDFAQCGDAKVIWELNRHQHFLKLAIAYRLTGDERYVRELVAQWESWHAANPYAIGINWASSLEVAFRSLSWLWTYHLLERTPAMTAEFRRAMLRSLFLNARHIERNLSTYFSPNTHLLGEAVALFFVGTLCPRLRHAERWKRRGWDIIVREQERQVRADGLHFEQSAYYHVYALDFFLYAMILASKNGLQVPGAFAARIANMLDALAEMCSAGTPMTFGDDDGGRVFDPRRNGREHYADPLSTGAALFERAQWKMQTAGLTMETVFLLGESGVQAWDRLEPCDAKTRTHAFEQSGMYCLAGDGGRELLCVDAGPLGALHGGHGHADALSVSLYKNGVELLTDAGTGQYVDAAGLRAYYRGTSAHNTLQLDGVDQADARGLFGWAALPAARAERWIEGAAFTMFSGSHDGYRRFAAPALHRRWVVAFAPSLWLVRDVVEGTAEHHMVIRWHLGASLSASSREPFVFRSPQNASLAIVPLEGAGWTHAVRRGAIAPVYGTAQPTAVLESSAMQALPAEFATVLLSDVEPHAEPGELVRIAAENARVSAYCYRRSGDAYVLVFNTSGEPWSVGVLESDAEFLAWKTGAQGDCALSMANATWAAVEGEPVVNCSRRIRTFETPAPNGEAEFHCSDPAAVTFHTRGRKALSEAH